MRWWDAPKVNTWLTIGASVVTILGPILAYWLFLSERGSKAILVTTVSRSTVADLSDPALSALKLTFQDEAVNRVTTATIEISNSGTQPITPADFERPLTLRFPGATPLLTATIGERTPTNLNPTLTSDAGAIHLAPILLNSGDRFRLTLLLRDVFTEPEVDARIAGVTTVSKTTLPDDRMRNRIPLALSALAIALTMVCYGFMSSLTLPPRRQGRKDPVVILPTRTALAFVSTLGLAASTTFVAAAAYQVDNFEFWGWPQWNWVLAVLVGVGTVVTTIGSMLGFRTRHKVQLNWQAVARESFQETQ